MTRLRSAFLLGLLTLCGHSLAYAQSSVMIYGNMNLSVDRASSGDPTLQVPTPKPTQVASSAYSGRAQRVSRETSNGSNLGFRGTEDLGDGLYAIWQIELPVSIDSGNSGNLRNTNVGLKGFLGTVFAGNWDTPYKATTLPFGAFAAPTAADANVIGNPGFNVPSTASTGGPSNTITDASFDRRQQNSIQYWSPVVGGFSARVAYAFGEVVGHASANVWSGAFSYENGPLLLQYAYEQHNDYLGIAFLRPSIAVPVTPATAPVPESTDRGHKLIAKYVWGDSTLRGVYERLAYASDEVVAGRVNGYRRDAWLFTFEQRFGLGKLWLAYGRAGAGQCGVVGNGACSTTGLGATQSAIGYWYDLSKRTAVYSFYNRLSNETSARYGIGVPLGAKETGTTTKIVSIGISHRF